MMESRVSGLFAAVLFSFAFILATEASDNSTKSNSSVVVYWGAYKGEGSLHSACDTGNYNIVVLSFLNVFGNGNIPQLDFADHCNNTNAVGCAAVGADVKACQSKGVKVFLSLGGADGNYSIASRADAAGVAGYLWNNFLQGNASDPRRPLGAGVVLDGIDFDMEMNASKSYADLAKEIKSLATRNCKPVYLSAAPQCPYPDEFMAPALQTGLFDYIWIQFYNNEDCHYHPNKSVDNVVASWKKWERGIHSGKLLIGLPASPRAATDEPSLKDGYMPAKVLLGQLLPRIKQSSRYGGIMLWSYYYDIVLHDGRKVPYSTTIRNKV